MNDPDVLRTTAEYVCVIIRRPHAYHFLGETFASEGGITSSTPAGSLTAEGTLLPLPGLYILDSEGSFIAASPIHNVDEVLELLEDPESLGTFTASAKLAPTEQVSIRVSGFIAAEGIT